MKSFNYWAVGLGRSVTNGSWNAVRAAAKGLRREYIKWLRRNRRKVETWQSSKHVK